ncbi:hypothetical protein NQD34_009242 [Periophthalmus magnuspinnatus]|nr:hypothetical protein NQD34_009242 [Periophthalmus magnuspinnatus]
MQSKNGLSAEKKLNQQHSLNKMNNLSLGKEKQENMRGGPEEKQENMRGGPEETQEDLRGGPEVKQEDLRGGPEVKQEDLRGGPEVKVSNKEIVSGRGLSPHSCGPQVSVLSSSSPTHLDLSHNDLQDSGEEPPCSGLKSAPCSQETPRS